jgi:hypothetical protein
VFAPRPLTAVPLWHEPQSVRCRCGAVGGDVWHDAQVSAVVLTQLTGWLFPPVKVPWQ